MLISVTTGLTTVLCLVVVSLLTGRYVQNRYNVLKQNAYLSYALGFAVYLTIVTLSFMPFVWGRASGTTLLVTWWIVNSGFVVFLVLNWRKLDLQRLPWRQWGSVCIFAAFLLLINQLFSHLQQDGDNFFYIPWVRGNEYTPHLNGGFPFGNGTNNLWVYSGEGWYYLQTVILRTTRMDQNFMNFWVMGGVVSCLKVSAVFGFTFFVLKKDPLWALVLVSAFTVPVGFAYNHEVSNVGRVSLVWNFVLLITLTLAFVAQPSWKLLAAVAFVNYAGFAFSSSQFFVGGIFLCGVAFLMLLKNSLFFMRFVFVCLVSFALMGTILLVYFSVWGWALSLEGLLTVVFTGITLLRYKRNWGINCKRFLVRFKWQSVSVTWCAFLVASLVLWGINGFNPWLNFAYNSDGLTTGNEYGGVNLQSEVIYWIIYGLFWVLFAWSVYILMFFWRNKQVPRTQPKTLMVVVALNVMFFFNPLVAPLVNGHLVPQVVYHRVRVAVFLPYVLLAFVWVSSWRFKALWTTLSGTLVVCGAVGTFAASAFLRNNLSFYTGVNKSLVEAAAYVQKKYGSKVALAGDLTGVRAYLENPFAFVRSSVPFDKLNFTCLTDKLYDELSISNRAKIDVLMKAKDKVQNFHPLKWNYLSGVTLGNYVVFAKDNLVFIN